MSAGKCSHDTYANIQELVLPFLLWVPGIELGSSGFRGKHFYTLSHLKQWGEWGGWMLARQW